MSKSKLIFNSKGINKLLTENYSSVIEDKAKNVARTVKNKVPEDVPVVVRSDINEKGRPASIVQIQHASGLARQAKDGVLTQSAAENGLDIKRY